MKQHKFENHDPHIMQINTDKKLVLHNLVLQISVFLARKFKLCYYQLPLISIDIYFEIIIQNLTFVFIKSWI